MTDVTQESGLGNFRNIQGSLAKEHIIETMGGGAAFFDYNRDGNLDVLLVRGSTVEEFQKGGSPVCALFRGDGRGHFQDVTAAAGHSNSRLGNGCCDRGRRQRRMGGHLHRRLWLECACYAIKETELFAMLTRESGLASSRWSVAASFADLDRDGDLDLYVANYLDYDLSRLPKRGAGCTYRGFDVFCGHAGCPAREIRSTSTTARESFRT